MKSSRPQVPILPQQRLPRIVAPAIGLISLWFISCKPETYYSEKNTLAFSQDTVWFDTVFTRKSGSTYPISVTKIISIKNPEKQPVKANFTLASGAQSQFRVSIDGESGTTFQDIEIDAKDSVFIFVQCKLEPNNNTLPVIVLDSLIAEINGQKRKMGGMQTTITIPFLIKM